ncbi:hypothetical protein KP509_1Z212700 [Ceratopteris richardii]|nr:hypothetical protein KP509_1Z212700 [Ceratopteris richardii]
MLLRNSWTLQRPSSMVFLSASLIIMIVVAGGWGGGFWAEGSGCPSMSQLAGACGQYVIGKSPPKPPSKGGCCNMLRSNSASCLCESIPKNAGSLVSKNAIDNIRSSCDLKISCPASTIVNTGHRKCMKTNE